MSGTSRSEIGSNSLPYCLKLIFSRALEPKIRRMLEKFDACYE